MCMNLSFTLGNILKFVGWSIIKVTDRDRSGCNLLDEVYKGD